MMLNRKILNKGINNFLSNLKYIQRKLKDRNPKSLQKDNRFLFLKENSRQKPKKILLKILISKIK